MEENKRAAGRLNEIRQVKEIEKIKGVILV